MPAPSPRPRTTPLLRPAQRNLAYFAGWLCVIGLYVVNLRQNIAPTWPQACLYAATYFFPAVALGLAVRSLVDRGAMQRSTVPRMLATYLAVGVAFTFLWHASFIGWLRAVSGPAAAGQMLGANLYWQLSTGLLLYGLLASVLQLERLLGERRARELAAVRAEMLALRGQLNPHFLFNTLHSITALVRENPRSAEDALVQFGALLRRLLASQRDTGDEHPLADELIFIEDYLALEHLRLGERLRIERSLSPAAKACWVPIFGVQPLVENAIRHAIAPRPTGGTLRLEADVKDGRLVVTVADDGPGASPDAVAASTGVGLSAIRQRLHLRHGKEARLVIDTAPDRGFRNRLELPAVHEPLIDAAP